MLVYTILCGIAYCHLDLFKVSRWPWAINGLLTSSQGLISIILEVSHFTRQQSLLLHLHTFGQSHPFSRHSSYILPVNCLLVTHKLLLFNQILYCSSSLYNHAVFLFMIHYSTFSNLHILIL